MYVACPSTYLLHGVLINGEQVLNTVQFSYLGTPSFKRVNASLYCVNALKTFVTASCSKMAWHAWIGIRVLINALDVSVERFSTLRLTSRVQISTRRPAILSGCSWFFSVIQANSGMYFKQGHCRFLSRPFPSFANHPVVQCCVISAVWQRL